MPYRDPKKRREYQREYAIGRVEKRREYHREYHAAHHKDRREYFRQYHAARKSHISNTQWSEILNAKPIKPTKTKKAK